MRSLIYISGLFLSIIIIVLFKECPHGKPEGTRHKIPALSIPLHWKVFSTFNIAIPINNTDTAFVKISNISDTSHKNTVQSDGTVWLIFNQATNRVFKGYSTEILYGTPHTENDSTQGAMDEWSEFTLCFNDSIEHPGNSGGFISGKDTFDIFPYIIDTLLVSPGGKYIALLIGQVEAGDIFDIIDAKGLATTGHYKIVKEINPYPGSIQKVIRWQGDTAIIIEADIKLTGLNKKAQLDDSDSFSAKSDSTGFFIFSIPRRLFSKYQHKN